MARMLTLQADPQKAAEAVGQVIRRGGVVAIPTESFYAVGASPFDEAAVRRVGRMKGRAQGKPLLVLIAESAQLEGIVAEVTEGAAVLMQRFWPGPLTIVFPAASDLPEALTLGTGTVGVRQPAYPALVELLRQTGPLTGTSANRSGEPPAQTAEEVQAALGSEVDVILDGGPTAGGLPSTIVQTVGSIRLLREGPIARDRIAAALAEAGLVLAS